MKMIITPHILYSLAFCFSSHLIVEDGVVIFVFAIFALMVFGSIICISVTIVLVQRPSP